MRLAMSHLTTRAIWGWLLRIGGPSGYQGLDYIWRENEKFDVERHLVPISGSTSPLPSTWLSLNKMQAPQVLPTFRSRHHGSLS